MSPKPIRVCTNPASKTSPVISSMMNYSASSTTQFLLPFALIAGRGLSPSQVGLILMCQPIVMAVMASQR